MSGEFLSEDNGATLFCDTCKCQVRSNEVHDCPGTPESMLKKLRDLKKCFDEMGDFNDIPQDQASEILGKAITELGGEEVPEEEHHVLTVNIDITPTFGITAEEVIENMSYEFTVLPSWGKINNTEIVASARR